MALPTKSVAWTYSLCNRITYASLVQVARDAMYLIKQRLVAVGYVVRGSSNGAAGAMDGVDRWASAADAGTRANSAVTPISWIVLTDANGYDVCFAYNSATDDVYRISISLETPFAAAGTATHQPTSTTEQTYNTFYTSAPGTIIGAGTSLDRLVSVWTRPDAKGFRVAIARSNAWTSAFGMDTHDPATFGGGVSLATEHGFYLNTPGLITQFTALGDPSSGSNASTSQFRVGARRLGLSNLTCSKGCESFGGSTLLAPAADFALDFAAELQGGSEYMLKRLSMYSQTVSHRGKVGNFADWWLGRNTGVVDGDVYGNGEFVVISKALGILWPWDGTPGVPGTAVVMA